MGALADSVLNMDVSYAITPFVTWFVAGATKFLINSVKAKELSFGLIGYGGLPSNHSAIVSSVATLVALREGIGHPAFGVAITVTFIVMLDANSLRGQVGKHAESINRLEAHSKDRQILRERMGHTRIEIAAGVLVGIAVAAAVHIIRPGY